MTRKGMLFCAAESSNHMLFTISSLSEDTAAAVAHRCTDDTIVDDDVAAVHAIAPTFTPSATLRYLEQTDEVCVYTIYQYIYTLRIWRYAYMLCNRKP
jgi:hypothetical protein